MIEKIDIVESSLRIQAFAKLILTRPTREEYKLYQQTIFGEASFIAAIEYDTVYKETKPEIQTEISLAGDIKS